MRAFAALSLMSIMVTGCTQPGGCTMIGSAPGVGVTVGADVAAELESLRLTICVAGRCHDHLVELAPGTRVAGETCAGTDPDDVCSASMAPDGTAVGFVDTEISEGPIMIGARYRRDGRTISLPNKEFRAVMTEPNGPNCGGGAPQAAVIIGANGFG